MCGIVGLLRRGGLATQDHDALGVMCDRLAHRGPDSSGLWTSPQEGVALGHRRLSILDTSIAGGQPMQSASTRYTIVFNGEIYNFAELRAELEGAGLAPTWRGHSDTEILLAVIEAYGVEDALLRLKGMFAFGLYDSAEQRLFLARDAFGEKPLYVADVDGAIIFASELKAICAHPDWRGDIDRQALVSFVRHGYIGPKASLFAQAQKVKPGSLLMFNARGERKEVVWFDHLAVATAQRRARFSGTPEEATQILDDLIRASVGRQSVADVSVGAFLSGGIDSSTIAAIMQADRATPIDTFTLGFVEEGFNEAHFARDVAKHIGSNHHEIILSGDDARDLVTTMPDVYDEPFADPSQLPTSMIARFARTGVKVCLSGDAGDELFAGYGRHHAIRRRWSGGLGGYATRTASALYAQLLLGAVVSPAQALGISRIAGRSLGPLRLRLEGLNARSRARTALEAYERSFTVIDQAHLFVRGGKPTSDPLIGKIASHADWSVLEQVTSLDAMRYLPDDILVKVDRAAMTHSLETRIPLLDPDVVRFAWSLPDDIRLMNGERKGVLKAVLSRYLPRTLWDRPKRGFGVPASAWLRGPLRPLAQDLFSYDTLVRQDLLDPDLTMTIWEDFLAGGQRRSNLVWTLFILQLYLSRLR